MNWFHLSPVCDRRPVFQSELLRPIAKADTTLWTKLEGLAIGGCFVLWRLDIFGLHDCVVEVYEL